MRKIQKISGEKSIQAAWNSIRPEIEFFSIDGRRVRIISAGTWNFEAGPDFKNAKIKMDGEEITGDIEVHRRTSDWFLHGHETDENYGNVILHIVGEHDKGPPSSAAGCEIPVIVMDKIKKTRFPMPESEKFPGGRCVSFFSGIGDSMLRSFFRDAGRRKFEEKARLLKDEMAMKGAESVCLRLIFEACGYKKNRKGFVELFGRFSRYGGIESERMREAVLWGESGLLPDPAAADLDGNMRSFVKDCWEIWWKTRKGACVPIKWDKSGVRPLNMPERRIASLTVLLSRFSIAPLQFIAGNSRACASTKDMNSFLLGNLVSRHPLWDGYTNFFRGLAKPSAVLGEARAVDLAANVILPCLSAYARSVGMEKLDSLALDSWLELPATQPNRTLKTAVHRWFMPPERAEAFLADAASVQGAMYIYKNHCEKCSTDCASCMMGSSFLPAHSRGKKV